MTSTEPILIDERDGGVVTVTLNCPEALNAAEEELRGAIAAVWPKMVPRHE